MLNEAASQLDTLLPILDPETKKPVKCRLKDITSATELYRKMRDADRINSLNRAAIAAMFDGEPPYNEAELVADGQGHRCNLNFGEAEEQLEKSMGGYVDLLNSVDRFIDTPLCRKEYPQSDKVFEWEKVIAEEFARALRDWPKFHTYFLQCVQYFVGYGVGFVFWDDEDDWQWKVESMANFFVPRKTLASETEIEVACSLRCYAPHQLWEKIEDPESAKEMGWNVEVVKQALLKSCTKAGSSATYTRWEELEIQFKNNDLWQGYAGADEIKTVHFWIKELESNKISHYISLESGENKDWLYKKEECYGEMSDVIIGYTYGIGTNGYYHSIRGLGYKIFPMVQVSNRARCQTIDGAMVSSSVLLQPQDEDAVEQMGFTYFGPYAVISPGLQVVPQGTPNLAQNMIPVLNDMASMIQNKSGQYSSAGPLDPKEKTKFEVQTDVSTKAKLTTTQLNLFYEPFSRHLRKVLKRFTRRNYDKKESGGCYVHKFIQRCVSRGVPLEAIYHVDADQAPIVRGIGGGSPEMRLVVLDKLQTIVGSMDDVGRHNWTRDYAACFVGYEQANRYVPAIPNSRIAPDAKIAELENSCMQVGQPQTVLPDEDHFTHASVHFPALGILNQQLQNDPSLLAQIIPTMLLMMEHVSIHVEKLSGNVVMEQQVSEMRQALSQLSEIAVNGSRELEKQQKQAAQAQQQGAQEAGTAPQQLNQLSPRILEDSIRAQEKLRQMDEEHRTRMRQEEESFKQRMAFKDIENSKKVLQP